MKKILVRSRCCARSARRAVDRAGQGRTRRGRGRRRRERCAGCRGGTAAAPPHPPRRRRAGAEQGRRGVDARSRTALVLMMSDPGAGAVLRRHGAREEHAVGADAGVRRVLADHRAVVRLRLQPRVHRRQRVLRQLRPAVPQGHVRLRRRASSRRPRRSRRTRRCPSSSTSRSRRRSRRSPCA